MTEGVSRDPDEAAPRTGGARVWIRVAIVVVLTALVIVGLVKSVGSAAELRDILLGADARLVLLAMAICLSSVALSAERWRFVLSAMGHRVPYPRALLAVLATWPLAVVLPSRAGDFFRALFVRETVPLPAGAGSVLAEKLVDVQSLGLMALVGCLWHRQWEWAALAAAVLVAEWVGIVLLFVARETMKKLPLVRRKPERVDQLLAALGGLRDRPRYLAALSVASIGSWCAASLVVWMLGVAVGSDVAPGTILSLFPLAIFAGLLPITLAGVGTRDATFLFLLQATGTAIDPPRVLAATLLYALLGTWVPAMVGLPVLLRVGVPRPQS